MGSIKTCVCIHRTDADANNFYRTTHFRQLTHDTGRRLVILAGLTFQAFAMLVIVDFAHLIAHLRQIHNTL